MPETKVALRSMPYPYRAMLALCSDLDNTPDWHTYWEIMRFLNTTQMTALGPGVGLEVGNSIYFDMPPAEFAYWNTSDAGREMVRALIRSGHIDCLHSYGDLAATRRRAGRALDELARHDLHLDVWVDHRVAPTNFGADIMQGRGDVPGAAAYHADLSCAYGIRYIWRGRITSVIGQDVPRRLGGLFNGRHMLRASQTLAKEALKGVLARGGHRKYAMHGPNQVLRRTHLRDGRPVYEFLRANPYWGGVQHADTAAGAAETITPGLLERLAARGGVCVFYTHLGKRADPQAPLTAGAVQMFRLLADRFRVGELLVTTTRRLLGYRRAAREVSFTTRRGAAALEIDLRPRSPEGDLPVADLAGLTFYVPEPAVTTVFVDGREVPDLRHNPADHTGRRSVSLPWAALEFPSL